MANAAQRRYWDRLVAMGCCLCGSPAEVAHCHGGSIVERLQEPKAKGVKLSYMDWLVLPLCPQHHRLGAVALDNDVARWEHVFDTQAGWIDYLIDRTGIDVWKLADAMRKPSPTDRGSGAAQVAGGSGPG